MFSIYLLFFPPLLASLTLAFGREIDLVDLKAAPQSLVAMGLSERRAQTASVVLSYLSAENIQGELNCLKPIKTSHAGCDRHHADVLIGRCFLFFLLLWMSLSQYRIAVILHRIDEAALMALVQSVSARLGTGISTMLTCDFKHHLYS